MINISARAPNDQVVDLGSTILGNGKVIKLICVTRHWLAPGGVRVRFPSVCEWQSLYAYVCGYVYKGLCPRLFVQRLVYVMSLHVHFQ